MFSWSLLCSDSFKVSGQSSDQSSEKFWTCWRTFSFCGSGLCWPFSLSLFLVVLLSHPLVCFRVLLFELPHNKHVTEGDAQLQAGLQPSKTLSPRCAGPLAHKQLSNTASCVTSLKLEIAAQGRETSYAFVPSRRSQRSLLKSLQWIQNCLLFIKDIVFIQLKLFCSLFCWDWQWNNLLLLVETPAMSHLHSELWIAQNWSPTDVYRWRKHILNTYRLVWKQSPCVSVESQLWLIY